MRATYVGDEAVACTPLPPTAIRLLQSSVRTANSATFIHQSREPAIERYYIADDSLAALWIALHAARQQRADVAVGPLGVPEIAESLAHAVRRFGCLETLQCELELEFH